MKRILLALFAALALSQAADAQMFRRARPVQGIGQWVLVDGRWVYIDVQPQALASAQRASAPKAPTSPAQPATVQADVTRPGGKVRDFIKRLLGR